MTPFEDIINNSTDVDILQYHIKELENMSESFLSRFNEIIDQKPHNEYFRGQASQYHTKHVFITNYLHRLRKRLKLLKNRNK